jgi:hypothetical protein
MEQAAKPRMRAGARCREPGFGPLAFRARGALVFLDFDGVLHRLGAGAGRFERAAAFLEALRAMERAGTPAKVALTTSWRFQPMAEILDALDLAAPGLSSFIEGRCGCIPGGSRLDEALDYVAKRPGGPPRALAALDDCEALYGPVAPKWLAPCDPRVGFENEQAAFLLATARSARPLSMIPLDFSSHPAARGVMFEARLWIKRAPTLLRKAAPEDVGRVLDTMVSRGAGWELEMTTKIQEGDVVARNPGEPIPNEWLIARERARQAYGEEAIDRLGGAFEPCQKIEPLRAARLGADEMAALGAPLNGSLLLATPWGGGPMAAREGDWISESGYSIAAGCMLDYKPWSAPGSQA